MISLGPPVALLSLAFASSSGLFSGTCLKEFQLDRRSEFEVSAGHCEQVIKKVLPGHCEQARKKCYQVTISRQAAGNVMSSLFSGTGEIISRAFGHL